MLSLSNYINENQDPKTVEKILQKVSDFLTTNETIDYIAVQKKPAVNISPDCIALTNKRVIFCMPKNLGFAMDFVDYLWKDIKDCHMKEGLLGAEFSVKTIMGQFNTMDYLPKAQARKLYQYAQHKEEEMHEYRRDRDLEEKRAAAGGVIVNTPPVPEINTQSNHQQKEDPIEVLQKLKSLLENDLITIDEYDAKKTEVLARM